MKEKKVYSTYPEQIVNLFQLLAETKNKLQGSKFFTNLEKTNCAVEWC